MAKGKREGGKERIGGWNERDTAAPASPWKKRSARNINEARLLKGLAGLVISLPVPFLINRKLP